MNKKKKQTIAAIAATALLVSGTYAWQAFDQIVRNESAGFDADQGARLHNDFDGSNADVYVENYASDSGATVFTRVRLYEYMELGTGAGNLKDSEGTALDYDAKVAAGITVLRGDLMENSKPNINDESTWDVYLHEGNSRGEEDIHTYLNINYGDVDNSNKGAKVYMPTFNKNFDDNTADIKGSLNNSSDRTEGDRVSTDAYDSYVEYTLGESMTGTAVYSKDALIAQNTSAGTIDGNTFLVEDEEHTAKSTLEGYVITMEDWLALEGLAQIGDFWVIDTDGWAYWANGIAPQTATSLLVDSITKVRQPDETYHYALHVEAQSATSDGWIDGVAAMNKGDIDENALSLMEMCWDTDAAIYTIDSIAMASPSRTTLGYGESLQLEATVTTSEEAAKATSVVWSIKEKVSEEVTASEIATVSDTTSLTQAQINGSLSSTGVFTPIEGMHLKYYTITATAKYDVTKTASTTIMAYDPELRNITISISEGSSSEINIGDTVQFESIAVGFESEDVTWSLVSSVTGASINSTSGLLTTTNYLWNDTLGEVEIQVQAKSKEDTTVVSAPITITVKERTVLEEGKASSSEILALIGTTNTLEVNGIEFYVLESGTFSSKTAVKLLAKSSVGSSVFHASSNVYSTSTVRTYVLDWYNNTFLPGGDVAHADVVTTGTTTRSTGDPAITTSDYAFLLSSDEASALSGIFRRTGSRYWLRSTLGSAGASYVYGTGNINAGVTSDSSVTNSFDVRPALWIYL